MRARTRGFLSMFSCERLMASLRCAAVFRGPRFRGDSHVLYCAACAEIQIARASACWRACRACVRAWRVVHEVWKRAFRARGGFNYRARAREAISIGITVGAATSGQIGRSAVVRTP